MGHKNTENMILFPSVSKTTAAFDLKHLGWQMWRDGKFTTQVSALDVLQHLNRQQHHSRGEQMLQWEGGQ